MYQSMCNKLFRRELFDLSLIHIFAYIDDPDIDLPGLMEYIKGPDFPTDVYKRQILTWYQQHC